MLGGLGANLFFDLSEAVARGVRYGSTEMPEFGAQATYAELHATFQALYPALRAVR